MLGSAYPPQWEKRCLLQRLLAEGVGTTNPTACRILQVLPAVFELYSSVRCQMRADLKIVVMERGCRYGWKLKPVEGSFGTALCVRKGSPLQVVFRVLWGLATLFQHVQGAGATMRLRIQAADITAGDAQSVDALEKCHYIALLMTRDILVAAAAGRVIPARWLKKVAVPDTLDEYLTLAEQSHHRDYLHRQLREYKSV